MRYVDIYQHLWAGSATSKGTRYILAGFIDHVNTTHEAFMTMYDPEYDGFAAQVGFKSGDLIVGIEVCEKTEGDVDGHETLVGRDEEVANGLQTPDTSKSNHLTPQECDPGAQVMLSSSSSCGSFRSSQSITADDEVQSASKSDGAGVAADKTGAVTRRMVDVTPMMSDEEWIAAAQSCEILSPGTACAPCLSHD